MNFGDHIFDYEWDLLILLDTCRPDALRAVANEYPFISNVEERWSVGGTSAEWVANTFDRQYLDIIKNTAYISSNPMAVSVLDNQFQQRFDGESKLKGSTQRLKKYGKYDVVKPEKIGKYRNLYETGVTKHGIYPSPRAVTDHGIQTDRLDDFDRIILHYMPPHHPYIIDSSHQEGDKCRRLEFLDKPRDSGSYEAYLDNLRWALEEVSIVLQNMDREITVISADHGESFSRIGNSHTAGSIKPSVRKVPWVETSAKDKNIHETDISDTDQLNQGTSREDTLRALGYLP
jgi:hypothetical protein